VKEYLRRLRGPLLQSRVINLGKRLRPLFQRGGEGRNNVGETDMDRIGEGSWRFINL